MKKTIKKIDLVNSIRKTLIILIITLIPLIDGFAYDNQPPAEKPKTKTCCKIVLPKPEHGPWTVINQIPVKVCKEIPIANQCE